MTRRLLRLVVATAMLSLAASVAAAPLTVTGRAIAENSDVRVTIELLPRLTHYAGAAARLAGDDQPAPVVSTRARADGSFSLTAPAAGMWTLRASAPGHIARGFALEPLVSGQAVPEVVLATAPARELRIADEAGSPLASVLVTAWGAPTDSLGDDGAWYAAVVHRWSDETGRVTLPALADQSRLLVERTGFLDLELDPERDEAAVVRLARGTSRELIVLGPTDRPEPEVLVFVGSSWLPSGTSDAGGRLRVAAPGEGSTWILRARDGRRVERQVEGSAPVAGQALLELRLPAAESVAGRVVEASSREPLAGAFVWSHDEPAAATTSGPRGDFRLPAPSGDGHRWLRAAAAGHFPTHVPLEPSTGRELAEITLALDPAAAVGGRVVDPDGRPLVGAEIRVAIDRGAGWAAASNGPVSTTSGTAGAFRLELVPHGTYVLSAHRDGFGAARERIVARNGDELELRLVPARRATGRLLDLDEGPIAGGEIRLRPQSAERRNRLSEADGGQAGYSDAEGRFVVDDLSPGAYDLTARAAGYAPLEVPGVAVGEAEATEIGDLLLADGAEITGRVVDPEGRPLADAAIYLPAQAGMPLRYLRHFGRPETRSAADGTFRIVDRQPGERVDLAVHLEGFAPDTAPAVVAGEGEPVEVVLRPVGKVRGRVVDERGRGIVSASVAARPSAQVPGPEDEPTLTDDEGRFTLDAVEPGAATIEASAPDFQAAILDPVEVPAGGEVSGLELMLQPAARIEGVVRTEDGEPVSGATVLREEPTQTVFRGMRRHRYMGADSGADGSFSLDGLAPGPHILTARHPRLGQAVRSVELELGRNRIDFVLDSGHEVAGRVVDASGAPVAGAALEVTPIGDRGTHYGNQQVRRSDGDGTFRLSPMADGRYQLSATAAGRGRATPLEIEVAGSDVEGLRLELAPQATIRGRILGLELDELAELRLVAFAFTGGAGGALGGVVDHLGDFVIEGAGAGHWKIEATTREGRTASAQVEVLAEADEAKVDLDFSGGLTLTGRVLRDGAPVVGVEVRAVVLAAGTSGRGTTDRDGRFRVAGLAFGSHLIWVIEPNAGWTHSETVDITGDLEHDLVLQTTAVSGQVVTAATGEPIARAIVSLAPTEGDVPTALMMAANSTESDSRGYFEMTSFIAGSHRLIVTAEGYALEELTLELTPGGHHEGLVVTLDAGPGIDLQIVARGMPLPGRVTLGVLAADGRPVTSGAHTLDATGVVHLGALPAGTWTLVAAAEGSAPVMVAVEVPGPTVNVVLEPAAELLVVVSDLLTEDRHGGATLTLTDAADNPWPPLTGPWPGSSRPLVAGRATLESLPAGTWTVTAETSDGRTWSATVALSPGERREVVLD